METSVHAATARQRAAQKSPAATFRPMAAPHRFALRQLTASEAAPPVRKPGLVPVGVTRALPSDVLTNGSWSTAPDGSHVWRLALQSPNAESVRVHFTDFHAGTGKVWLLRTAPDGAAQNLGPYTDGGPFRDGQFWSDAIFGDSVTIAYQPPADAPASGDPPFHVSELSHRFQASESKANATARYAAAAGNAPSAAAASCNLDVTCYSDYAQAASAVALIDFESDGGSYECTGSLIASASQPALPFFLTANHCVSSDAEARSVIAYFNYQTSTCNGTLPSRSNSPHVTGATYVLSEPMAQGDFSLLQLSAFPDVNVTVLGWSSDEIAADQQVAGISHPVGDYKRIAFGQRGPDATIRFSGNESMPANMGYQVDWFQGTTQSGSSGSPLIEQINGKQYLVGTLSGGPVVNDNNSAQVCAVRNLNASYGRFTAAYAYLADILNSTTGAGTGGSTPPPSGSATITANPNPIQLTAGQTNGMTTLTWHAPGVTQVQVLVNSPTGTPLTGPDKPDGSAQTGQWVTDGMTFYLQDASDGNASGAAKTLASVRARVISASNNGGGNGNPGRARGIISASPNPISVAAGQTSGSTTLTWSATGVTAVQIRVDSPTGTALTGVLGPNGSADTGNGVTDGTVFYLQDASDGNSSGAAKTLDSVRVRVVSGGGTNPGTRQGTITATPNPIRASFGRTTGSTTLKWQAVGVRSVQIRADSPRGPAVTDITDPSGAVDVRRVSDGTAFYLQDASSVRSSGASRTLASVVVRVTSQ